MLAPRREAGGVTGADNLAHWVTIDRTGSDPLTGNLLGNGARSGSLICPRANPNPGEQSRGAIP